MSSKPIVGFAGMTHLGLCSAAASASKDFQTVAYDPDSALIGRLRAGQLPVSEPGLDDLVRERRGTLAFTANVADLQRCQLVYVAPDIPTDDKGNSDLSPLDALLEQVRSSASAGTVVVVLSQVPPGFTRARQKHGQLLYYQVETLVFGRAVERATQPERFIVGCPDSPPSLPAALETFLRAFGCPILPMAFESAELTKIAINCCLVASVTVANTLAELCERIGANWSEMAPALKLDRRIGTHSYLTPGLGLSGGNLERDLATVLHFSAEYGTHSELISSFVSNSAYRKDWVLRTLHSELLAQKADATLAILGLAYKENTHSVKNSPSIALIRQLGPWSLRVFDPVVPPSSAPHSRAYAGSTALDAVAGADAVAIMTPWPAFRELQPAAIASAMRGSLVVDPYAIMDGAAARRAGLRYRTLGVGEAA